MSVLVTHQVLNGPFSCFDPSRKGSGRRVLEVDFSNRVENGDDDDSRSSGYFASVITDRTGAGSADCPWLLRAAPWQRINVTLIDFSHESSSASTWSSVESFGYNIVFGNTASRHQNDGDHELTQKSTFIH